MKRRRVLDDRIVAYTVIAKNQGEPDVYFNDEFIGKIEDGLLEIMLPEYHNDIRVRLENAIWYVPKMEYLSEDVVQKDALITLSNSKGVSSKRGVLYSYSSSVGEYDFYVEVGDPVYKIDINVNAETFVQPENGIISKGEHEIDMSVKVTGSETVTIKDVTIDDWDAPNASIEDDITYSLVGNSVRFGKSGTSGGPMPIGYGTVIYSGSKQFNGIDLYGDVAVHIILD